jgi:hypothetical protein
MCYAHFAFCSLLSCGGVGAAVCPGIESNRIVSLDVVYFFNALASILSTQRDKGKHLVKHEWTSLCYLRGGFRLVNPVVLFFDTASVSDSLRTGNDIFRQMLLLLLLLFILLVAFRFTHQ